MKAMRVALLAAGLVLAVLAFAGTAGAASFVGTQTGPSEWTYTLTYDPFDNYGVCPAPGSIIGTIASRNLARITLSGLAGVVSATAPTSTDFTPLGGLLDAVNLEWMPQVLAGGTSVAWTHIGGGTGNFGVAKHVYGFKVHTATPATSGQVNVASSGFSTEFGVSQPCPVQPADDRDFTAITVGPVAPVAPAAGFVVVAGSVKVTTRWGDPYFIKVSVVRGPDGRVTGAYRHSDSLGNYGLVEAQCIRLSPGRATIAGIVRKASIPNPIGTWAALHIDDRGGIVGSS